MKAPFINKIWPQEKHCFFSELHGGIDLTEGMNPVPKQADITDPDYTGHMDQYIRQKSRLISSLICKFAYPMKSNKILLESK